MNESVIIGFCYVRVNVFYRDCLVNSSDAVNVVYVEHMVTTNTGVRDWGTSLAARVNCEG